MKYRLVHRGLNKSIERWKPPSRKEDGKMSKGRWENWMGKYFGKWRHLVEYVLDDEIEPLGDELREQLERFPEALEAAVERVMEGLGVGDE